MRKPLYAISAVILVVFTTYLVYYSPLNKAVVLKNELIQHSKQAQNKTKSLVTFLEETEFTSDKLSKQVIAFGKAVKLTEIEISKTDKYLKLSNESGLSEKISNFNSLKSKNAAAQTVVADAKILLNKLKKMEVFVSVTQNALGKKEKADALVNQAFSDLNMEYFEQAADDAEEALSLYKQSLDTLKKSSDFNPIDIVNSKKAINVYSNICKNIIKISADYENIERYNREISRLNKGVKRGSAIQSKRDYLLTVINNDNTEIPAPNTWLKDLIDEETQKLRKSLSRVYEVF